LFVGEHYGYTRLINPIIHQRTIKWMKEKKICKIVDSFKGKGVHKIELCLILDPNIKYKSFDSCKNTVLLFRDRTIWIEFENIDRIKRSIEKINYSQEYGMLLQTNKITYSIIYSLPLEIKWKIIEKTQ